MPLPYTFSYPLATELQEIEQDLVWEMEKADPVFFKELFPVENANTDMLEWEQWDNFYGLQQARGLDGMPSPVARLGSNRFSVQPGYYGEYTRIDERELTKRAKFASYTGSVDVTDLVQMGQRFLLKRRQDRQRWLGWTLLTTGSFLVAAPNGGYEHRDTYSFKTLTASPAINNLSTGAPFAFMLSWNTEGRGSSSKFGPDATCYANQTTINTILNNQNANDLGGRYKLEYGQTVNSLPGLNSVLASRGLPQLGVYDETYLTSSAQSSYVNLIPDGYGVLIGKRTTGTPLGKYRMTINMHNGGQPGPYTIITNTYGVEPPDMARLQIDDGHNGGPVIQFPSAVRIIRFW